MPLEEEPAPTAKDAVREQTTMANRLDAPVAGSSNLSQRQGFCSYCQVLYSSVEQHISSAQHREVVGRTARANVSSESLLDRFLQDVLQHHPHRYNDTHPTYADLPCLSTLPIPIEVLSEVYCGSEDDGLSIGTREKMPSSDDESCPIVQPKIVTSQEQEGPSAVVSTSFGAGTIALTGIISGKVGGLVPPLQEKYSPTQGFFHRTSDLVKEKTHISKQLPQTQPFEPPCSSKSHIPTQLGSLEFQHRKAHRKTNKHRKNSESCSDSPALPTTKCITSQDQLRQSQPAVDTSPVHFTVLPPWKDLRKKTRRSEESDQIHEAIEEVIERCCYGRGMKTPPEEDESVFHFSLHSVSGSKDSEDWDILLKGALEKNTVEDKHLACLMQEHVNLDDHGYKAQLDTALNAVLDCEQTEPKEAKGNPLQKVIPDLPHIPLSFVGKTWEQVQLEDDLKIERMVKEFRQGHFHCYFDSESLTKFEKHGEKRRKGNKQKNMGNVTECKDVLPLTEHQEDDHLPVFRKTRHRTYRMASRCQVVKVSHGTQTAPLSCPVVRRKVLPETADLHTSLPLQKEPSPERTPDMKTRLCALKLPASYCKIISPLQPKTLVYVLASPDGSQSSVNPTANKRIGLKRKLSHKECLQKYKYKKTPLKYYDALTNRILNTPPRGLSSNTMTKSLSHVRQLFRSLSPDINKALHGSAQKRTSNSSRKSKGEGSMADLSASTSGSCLGSGGPSELDSSLSSNRKALYSRSSISTSSQYHLGRVESSTSYAAGSSRAKASSHPSSTIKDSGSELKKAHSQTHMDQPRVRRHRQGASVPDKLISAKKPSAPPYRTKRRSSKVKTESTTILQHRISTRIAAGCRVSPRNKTRVSPKTSGSSKLDL